MYDRRTVRIPALLALVLLITGSGSGCGYRFVEYGNAGEARRQISVVTLENDSEEPGIELLASEALRHEILTRGGLRLGRDPARADFTLRGRVLRVHTLSRSFSGVASAREYEVTLRFELRVDPANSENGRIERTEFEASEIYLASADISALRKNRQEALRYLSGLLASRVHDAIDRDLLSVLQ